MLAHPYLPQLLDSRMVPSRAVHFVPSSDIQSADNHLKRQMMPVLLPFDAQRRLQTEMLLHQRSMAHAHLQNQQLSGSTAHSQHSRRQPKTKPSKRVIAVNLPSHLHTIESVTGLFYPYGEILLVRVLRPGKQLPFDLKQYQPKVPDLGTNVCAIIEFESSDSARFAVNTLKFRTKELGFRLTLLEVGAEEELYGPAAEPQLPMLPPGQTNPGGISEESGIELSNSGRSSGSDIDRTGSPPLKGRKDRVRVPSSSGSDQEDLIKKEKQAVPFLTEKWNPNVQEFVPSFGTPVKKETKVEAKPITSITDSGRIVTSVSISLSKPKSGRQTNKIQLTEKKATIRYSREFLLSKKSEGAFKVDLPDIEGLERTEKIEELKRYAPPQRRQQRRQPSQPTFVNQRR